MPALWGTMSVLDHTRPRPFFAEILLYDKIVVPVPIPDDDADWARWATLGRRPERQRELLDILGRGDHALEIPWTEELRDKFERAARTLVASQPSDPVPEATLRSNLASAIEMD